MESTTKHYGMNTTTSKLQPAAEAAAGRKEKDNKTYRCQQNNSVIDIGQTNTQTHLLLFELLDTQGLHVKIDGHRLQLLVCLLQTGPEAVAGGHGLLVVRDEVHHVDQHLLQCVDVSRQPLCSPVSSK